MNVKRVLVIYSDHLLAAGVESLLTRQGNLTVMSASIHRRNLLTREIERFQPDVVVLDESLQFTDFPQLLELLKDYPKLRVIVVDTVDNIMHIYDKHQIAVTHGNDLVSAIQKETHRTGLASEILP